MEQSIAVSQSLESALFSVSETPGVRVGQALVGSLNFLACDLIFSAVEVDILKQNLAGTWALTPRHSVRTAIMVLVDRRYDLAKFYFDFGAIALQYWVRDRV